MPKHSRCFLFAALFLICVGCPAFSQATERFVIKPGQAVYVIVVQGDCGSIVPPMIINGQVIISDDRINGPRPEAKEERKILGYSTPLPQAAEALRQALAKDKTFVVAESLDKADFIFHVCALYLEDFLPPEARQRMNLRSQLGYAEARVLPAAIYRADKEALFAPSWKAKTPDPQRPVSPGKMQEKKKKENPPRQTRGAVFINGVPVDVPSLTESKPADFNDLLQYFLQDYAQIAAVPMPQAPLAIAPAEAEPARPALTNKPEEAPLETTRPALVKPTGEPLTAAEPRVTPAPEPEEVIKVDTALVYVPVRVLDKDGKYIPDLKQEEFKVFEDEVAQEIEHFSAVDDPFHVVLLLDMSGSTRFKVEDIQDAALEFIEHLRPQDRVLVASFERAVFVDADFTNERAKLTKAILRTRSGRSTRLYDAVDLLLLERLNRIQGRKAIVLFTDGVDTASNGATLQGNLRKIEEANVLVYPIRYDTMPDFSAPLQLNGRPVQLPPQMIEKAKAKIKEDYDRAKMYMTELALRSGGRSYEAATLTDAKSAFANIADELRRQYWLSYYSSNARQDGSFRKIRVAVKQADSQKWAVRAKNGYRAPAGKK
jgi:Ca-activated chloride channel homolog